MQPRQNDEAAFSVIRAGKGAGNGPDAPGSRWRPLRGCGQEMLW